MLGLGLGASKSLTAAAISSVGQSSFSTSTFKTRVQNDGGTWEAELSLNNEITRLQAI
jgi:hypothetical protein